METQVFPRPTGRGLRKLTAGHLVAARLADQAPALPQGVRHPNQLLAALRRAAPHLGHTRLLPLMEALFCWTQPRDWAPDSEPVVWPSNDELANTLGCSERHVSRLIAAAIEAGLIVARDGTDRKRRGFRKDGRILWAWGLSLRPMAAHHARFLRAAEDGEESRRRCRALRRQGASARQFIGQLVVLAQAQGMAIPALGEFETEASCLATDMRQAETTARLGVLAETLQDLAAKARTALEQAVERANMSGSVDSHVRPLPTHSDFESEKSGVTAHEEVPAQTMPHDHDGNAGCSVSPAELLHLAPRLRDRVASSRATWSDIAEAASGLAHGLGIPARLYGEACGTLGRQRAAVAVAIISTKPPGHFHTAGCGGYLRGMLHRAARGELFLDRSLHGLREATFGKLTAVNTADAVGGLYKMRYS